MAADEPPFARPIPIAAFAVMIIATAGGNLVFGHVARPTTIAALSLPYLVLSTIGWAWCERRGGAALRALLVLLYALTVALLWASDQGLFLFVFPPLLLVVLYAGVRWGVAAIVGFAAFATILNVQAGLSLTEIYLRSTGFVPGAILTVAFSHVLLRERRAQRELAELAAVRERNRIARDIHDSVGHYLTVVHVQIEAARAIVGRDPAAAEECLVRAQGLAREGLGELRRSVSMLRAARPFDVSLARLVDDTTQAGLAATLAIEGAPRALEPAVEVALYRAMQEALTNAARHARATRVRATLAYHADEVVLRVSDDGDGAATTAGGFGLAGMRERIAAVGGDVDVATAPAQGFTVNVRVPA